MTTGRQSSPAAGFGRSNRATYTIPSGASGAAVAAADLGRNSGFW